MKIKYFCTICVVLTLILTGCTSDNERFLQEAEAAKAELKSFKKQLIVIAEKVGIPPEKAAAVSTKELLTDIEIRLSNDYIYQGGLLSKKELERLSILLTYDTETLKKIKDYHEHVQTLKNANVILIENNQQ